MITAETVNGIVRFQANGLPVVSLDCRVDPGASQREVRARVDSLLDQIRPLAKDRDLDHRYRLSVRTDIERIKDALGSERWPPGTIAIFSCSGRDLYEEIPLPRRVREQVTVDKTPLARPMLAVLGEYPARASWSSTGRRHRSGRCTRTRCARCKRSPIRCARRATPEEAAPRTLPHELRGRVAGTFNADPVATPVAEIRSSAEGVMQEALIDQLEARREELLRRLGQPHRTNGS